MKKLCLCLSALLLISSLAGCQKKDISEPMYPDLYNTQPQFTYPEPTTTTTNDFVELPEPEVPPVTLEPVTTLSSVRWTALPRFMSLGEGRVLACRNDYVEGQGTVNFLEVLDVYQDIVLTKKQINSPRELLEQYFLDGHFVLKDPKDQALYIYDANLQLVQKVSVPNCDGFFSQDRTDYYFLEDEVLYRMDVESGDRERMELQYDLRFERLTGVHPYWNIVAARYYRSFYDDSYGICAINCDTGEFLILNEETDHLWFDGQTFYAAATNDYVYGVDIGFGSLFEGMAQKVSAPMLGGDTVSYTMLSGSGFLLHRSTAEDEPSTTVYDLGAVGISCKLAQYGYNKSTMGAVYLRQEQLIFGVYSEENEFTPVVIDPKALNYEKSLNLNKNLWPALVDRISILRYQKEVEGPALSENLASLQQQAQQLEQKYGVKILLETQAQALCPELAQLQADETLIAKGLLALDQALGLYPQNFFSQFRNGIGDGGIYFCLTGAIQGSLDPVGKTQKTRNRYELLLDVSAEDLDKTIHHELWHAIEMKISTTSFDDETWNALNPNDRSYYGHYDEGIKKYTKWTYASTSSKCYFVDSYARINAREDRARIMEYVMATDASDLMRSSVLKKKLQIMSDALREHFDTDGWNTVHWEQYL